MDKELAAGSSPESGGQWLNVWEEISGEWCPLGLGAGAILFCIFISDIGSGVQCAE